VTIAQSPGGADHAAQGAGPDPDTYNAYVAGLQIQEVQVVRLFAERLQVGPAATNQFEMQAGYQRPDASTVHYRYDVIAHIAGEEGNELARIEAAVVVGMVGQPGDDQTVERFGATSGAMIAHPFLREVVASTALRLGVWGVVLPLMTHARVIDDIAIATEAAPAETGS
jgi:hypothetical protein